MNLDPRYTYVKNKCPTCDGHGRMIGRRAGVQQSGTRRGTTWKRCPAFCDNGSIEVRVPAVSKPGTR